MQCVGPQYALAGFSQSNIIGSTVVPLYIFFPFFFLHRSNSALHRPSSIEILLDHWASFCRGASQCPFFVSGSSRIRTHVLVLPLRQFDPLICIVLYTATTLLMRPQFFRNYPLKMYLNYPSPLANPLYTTTNCIPQGFAA